jgi:hypothetical protein
LDTESIPNSEAIEEKIEEDKTIRYGDYVCKIEDDGTPLITLVGLGRSNLHPARLNCPLVTLGEDMVVKYHPFTFF